MIPKLIHYCWLSKEPYPETIQKCINSWKKYLPDYELMLWNFERFPKGTSVWVDQAYDNKKYAFAADYLRLYALYNYGGIYLDSDVEVLQNFDDLLNLPYFMGQENSPYGIEAAIIGAEKKAPWVKDCLDYYEGKQFVAGLGKFEMTPLPKIMLDILTKKYQINDITEISEFNPSHSVLNRFPVDWFSPKKWDTGELFITKKTKSIHHFSGTWKKNKGFVEQIRHSLSILKYNIKKLIR